MRWSKNNIKEKKEKIRDRINEVLELPAYIMGDSLRINIIDDTYMLIEGKTKVADYFDNYIKIKTEKYIIAVEGSNLAIKEISDTDLIISGEICNISYIK